LHDLKSYEDLLTKPNVSDYLKKHDIKLNERTLDLIFTIFESDDKGSIKLSDFTSLFQCDQIPKENPISEEEPFISKDGFAWTRAPSDYSSSDILAYRIEETLVSLKDQLAYLQKQNWCYSRSPLAYATVCGSVKLVRQFLVSGSNPNEADSLGRTPIHICASLSQAAYFSDNDKLQECENSFNVEVVLDIIEALVEKGAHVNALTCSNRTALHECFCSSDSEITKSALSDLNLRAKALVVRRLLQWGADPAILDRKGISAIHYCCQEDNLPSLLEFIQHYKSQPKKLLNLVSTNGRNVLHTACFSGAFSCAKLLCRWDADNFGQSSLRSAEDKLGKVPTLLLPPHIQRSGLDNLWNAALSGQTIKINMMLNAKTSKSKEPTWENVEGEDRLDCTKASAKNAKYGDIWTVSGIDSKSRRLLWSAIHFAVYGWIALAAAQGSKCAKRLLPRKNIKILSTGANYGGSLALLLSRNAYVDSLDYKCRTALMISAAANLVDAITLLIDHGADTNCTDINGNTPLHYAYAFGAASAVIALEARGANDSKENFSSCTPIEMAGKGNSLLPLYH
jgi:ankyrin repeat protein